MIEFIIVENREVKDLVSDVNKLLRDGWELRGDTRALKWTNDSVYYYQTMTKETLRDPYT